MSRYTNCPVWLQSIGNNQLTELALLTQQMSLDLVLCAHMSEDTAILGPLWSQCVSLTHAEISRVGLEQIALTLGARGVVVREVGEGEGLLWQAEFVMVAVIERCWEEMSSLCWQDANSISQLPRLSPSIVNELNEESLVKLGDKIQADQRGFLSNGRIVPYHEKLSLNSELIHVLLRLASDKKNTVAIAPNYWKSVLVDEFKELILEDHAYGRPYHINDINNSHIGGRTVHTAPVNPDQSMKTYWKCIMQKLQKVEFSWTSKEGMKIFQVEEIRSIDQWRYLHAIYDIESESFTHLDGAWMVYDTNTADQRRQHDARFGRPKAEVKTKLFRVDGEFNIEHFSLLSTLFFRNNPLVAEYFEGHTGPSVETTSIE